MPSSYKTNYIKVVHYYCTPMPTYGITIQCRYNNAKLCQYVITPIAMPIVKQFCQRTQNVENVQKMCTIITMYCRTRRKLFCVNFLPFQQANSMAIQISLFKKTNLCFKRFVIMNKRMRLTCRTICESREQKRKMFIRNQRPRSTYSLSS